MTKELTEQEYIELAGHDGYVELVNKCFKTVVKCEKFNNGKPEGMAMMIWELMEGKQIIVECTWYHKTPMIDFGITRMVLTDEEMPDITLDRMSELFKHGFSEENQDKDYSGNKEYIGFGFSI
jgi:hypothetical protein